MTTTIYDYLPHEWLDIARMETAYLTDVTVSSDSQAEERSALLMKPLRTVGYHWRGLSSATLHRIIMNVLRSEGQRIYIPILQDALQVTSMVGGDLACDPTGTRFVVGASFMIYEIGPDGFAKHITIKTVTGITPGTTVSTGSSAGYLPGCWIAPVMLCEVALSQTGRLQTDTVGELTVSFDEVSDAAGLPPSIGAGAVPAGVATFDDGTGVRPIFNIEKADWLNGVDFSLVRPGEKTKRGIVSVIYPRGPRGAFGYGLSFVCMNKAEFAALLQFFESRRGQLLPFWMASPASPWDVVALTTTYFDIVASVNLQNITDFIPFIAVVMNDGTTYIRPRDAVVDNGATWRVNLGASLPVLALSDVKRVTYACLMRFSSDSLVEEWETDQACRVNVKVQEMFNEFSVTGF